MAPKQIKQLSFSQFSLNRRTKNVHTKCLAARKKKRKQLTVLVRARAYLAVNVSSSVLVCVCISLAFITERERPRVTESDREKKCTRNGQYRRAIELPLRIMSAFISLCHERALSTFLSLDVHMHRKQTALPTPIDSDDFIRPMFFHSNIIQPVVLFCYSSCSLFQCDYTDNY